ncbi:MAG: 50S ribosomal protein L35ae [Candidatus Bathyarchaeota archaeon]|nr:50S ribosomal protein L35ae [Candidatus Bathyarchaeota archaeon]MCZ2845509.1 50S ribosomal protein L35ae [Candidatus Bathyarchaeota archaeon]
MPNKNLDKEDEKINSKTKIDKSKSKTKNKPKIEADKSERKPKSKLKNKIKKTKLKSEKKGMPESKIKAREQVKSPKSEKKPEKAMISKPKPKTRAVAKVKKDLPKLEKTKIYGILVNYRLGHSSQHNREFLIRIPNVNDNLKASKFIGHKAIWKSKRGTKIIGNILCIHGKNGVLRARFRKGLPGQVRGKDVEII